MHGAFAVYGVSEKIEISVNLRQGHFRAFCNTLEVKTECSSRSKIWRKVNEYILFAAETDDLRSRRKNPLDEVSFLHTGFWFGRKVAQSGKVEELSFCVFVQKLLVMI